MSALRDVVEMIAEQERSIAGHNKSVGVDYGGLYYVGSHDFVAQHGVAYEIGECLLPAGTPKACFQNAAVVAHCYPDLRYVEGFASTAATPGFPVHHAWNIDEDDLVIDTTWADRFDLGEYLGVEFPLDVVTDALFKGSGSVLNDWQRGCPIYRQPWVAASGRAE